MINKTELTERLFAMQRFGIKPGLERTLELAESAGMPQNKFKSIHAAGTNGKGSVCSIIASVLTESGYKTGLYTSPHILDFNERIRVNGVQISDDKLIELAAILLPEAEKIGATFFEITTVLAFMYFAECEVDFAVIETGLGGRYDSTNIINPELSIITSIDIDHTEYLGNTIGEIAFEKAGIIKKGVPVVINETKEEALNVIINRADELGSAYVLPDKTYKSNILSYSEDMSMMISINKAGEEICFKTALAGSHQLSNHTTAYAALDILSNKYSISTESIQSGLENLKINSGLRARMELVNTNPPIVMDVCHNAPAFAYLRDTVQNCFGNNIKWKLIYGAMADKDILSMLKEIVPICSELVIAVPNIQRAETAVNIMAFAKSVGFEKISVAESVCKAAEHAKTGDTNCLIAGSFHIAEEAVGVFS